MLKLRIALFFFSGLFLVTCTSTTHENAKSSNGLDSLDYYIEKTKDTAVSKEELPPVYDKAYGALKKIKDDTLRTSKLRTLAFRAYKNNLDSLFLRLNEEAKRESIKYHDSFGIADTYWNYGNYYSDIETLDSAYFYFYHAYKLFSSIGERELSARMLYNTAVIQKDLMDYTGAEISCIKTIEILNSSEEPRDIYLFRAYNLLGNIYRDLKDFDRAIESNTKSLEYLNQLDDKKTFVETNANNLGLIYQDMGENHKAIECFRRGLESKTLKVENVSLYAKLLDNLTYNRFLVGDTTNIEKDFLRALKIRDSIDFVSGVIISNLHMADYYASKKDTLKAVSLSKEALELSEKVFNHRDVLQSLQKLSELDKPNASTYFSSYIKLNDSLIENERALREKFAKIRFETDTIKQKNEKLVSQRILIITIGLTAISILLLLFFVKSQQNKYKRLTLENKQKEANQEIYKLMMTQRSKMEEAKLVERQRISEELHDGILGKLFGARLGFGFLDIKGDDPTISNHKKLVEELHEIEKEIRVISHDLKNETLHSDIDFGDVIKFYVQEQEVLKNYTCEVAIEKNIDWDTIDDHVKINIYRILQEALLNVVKHSQATKLSVILNKEKDYLAFVIMDNGIGFDKNMKVKGMGLKNIQSRIKKLHGSFELKTYLGQGVQLKMQIPIDSYHD